MARLIKYWNQDHPFNTILYDQRFVSLLMMKAIGKAAIVEKKLPKKQMKFIQGKNISFSLNTVFSSSSMFSFFLLLQIRF